MKAMYVPNNKNISAKIVPRLYSVMRDIQLGGVFVVVVGSHSKIYCIDLASPLLYNPEQVIQIRVYICFHDKIFYYYLITTGTLTFGNIK